MKIRRYFLIVDRNQGKPLVRSEQLLMYFSLPYANIKAEEYGGVVREIDLDLNPPKPVKVVKKHIIITRKKVYDRKQLMEYVKNNKMIERRTKI